MGAERFCAHDATPLSPAPATKSSNSLLISLLVLAGIVVACVIAGAVLNGTHRSSKKTAGTPSPSPTATPAPLSDAQRLALARQHDPKTSAADTTAEVIRHLTAVQPTAREYKEAQALLKKFEKRGEEISRQIRAEAAEAAQLGPKPENSAWDGSVREVDKYLRAHANDYDSVEYLEWSPVAEMPWRGEKYWGVRCKFRAANAFGGRIINEKVFLIRGGEVVHVLDF